MKMKELANIQYTPRGGTAGDSGHSFEYKMCSLLYLRAMSSRLKFLLASNVDNCGAFDDIIFQFSAPRKTTFFIQLKHKETRKMTKNYLLANPKSKSGFSLLKYYASYVEIKGKFNADQTGIPFDGNFEDCLFFLCTNASIENSLLADQEARPGPGEILIAGGSLLQFTEDKHPEIFEKMNDLPHHKEFFSQFYIIYNQKKESNLDEEIMIELNTYLKLPEMELQQALISFNDDIKNWWLKPSQYLDNSLTEDSPLQKAYTWLRITQVRKLAQIREIELQELNLNFLSQSLTYFKEKVANNDVVLIFSSICSTTITVAKLHQALGIDFNHVIFKLPHLREHSSDIMFAWKQHHFKTLVVEVQPSKEDWQSVYEEISRVLTYNDRSRKVVFILQWRGNVTQIESIDKVFAPDYIEIVYDSFAFSDFKSNTQNFLLAKDISLQGYAVPLSKIVNNVGFDMLRHKSLDLESVTQLLSDDKAQVGAPLEDTIEEYIDRTLQQNCINEDIFMETGVVFALSGVTMNDIKSIIPSGEHASYFIYWKLDDSNRFILVDNVEQFNAICKRHEIVHWLFRKNKTWLWKQSQGDLTTVNSYLNNKHYNHWQPNILLDGDSRIVLIMAEPGMGKSTLLTHVARQTKKENPQYWIVRININEYTNILNEFEVQDTIKLLEAAAINQKFRSTTLELDLLQHCYMSKHKMFVLIDGIDEVCPLYSREIILFIKNLLKTNIEKIWITSRPFMKNEIENEFKVLSYSLVPFNQEDQKKFLVKFWKKRLENKRIDTVTTELLENIACQVLETAIRELRDQERDFMGVPLQSVLLAEFFENKLEYLLEKSNISSIEIDIFVLYNSYIDKKWKIYQEEKRRCDPTNSNIQSDDAVLHKDFIQKCKKAAILTILSNDDIKELGTFNIREEIQGFLTDIHNGIHKTGIIIDANEGKPVFIHRTFAEYFLALWFNDNLEISKDFLQKHILEERLHVVRHILERILAKNLPLHYSILNRDEQKVKTLISKGFLMQKDAAGRSPIHISVSHGLTQFTSLLLIKNANFYDNTDVDDKDALIGLSPLEFAVKHQYWDILSEILNHRPNIRQNYFTADLTNNENIITSLVTSAARRGLQNLLLYLFRKGVCVNIILLENNSSLLHEAAQAGRVETVRSLIEWGSIINAKDNDGKTPLHISAERGDLDTVQCIFQMLNSSQTSGQNKLSLNICEQESKLSLQCQEQTSFWRHVLRWFQKDTADRSCGMQLDDNVVAYYKSNSSTLIRKHEDSKIDKINIVHMKDNGGNSALHIAAIAGHDNVVRYLVQSGAQLEQRNNQNDTALILAARNGHNQIVKTIVGYGCSNTSKALEAACETGQLETARLLLKAPLQFDSLVSATRNGHLDVVKLLVKSKPSLVNYMSASLETPLFMACTYGDKNIVDYYIKMGLNIEAETDIKNRALHSACDRGHFEIAKALLYEGAEVNCKNSKNETPVYLASVKGYSLIVNLLLQAGADITVRTINDSTAMLAACRENYMEVIEMIISYGGNVLDKDTNDDSCLHAAASNGNLQLSKRILDLDEQNYTKNNVKEYRKILLNLRRNDGYTPLELAILRGHIEITFALLDQNPDVDENRHPYFLSAACGHKQILQYFIEKGINLDMQDSKLQTALHLAIKSGQLPPVLYLIQQGASVNVQDIQGWTPLHYAVNLGYIPIVKCLVERLENKLYLQDLNGNTALHIAVCNNLNEIVKLLLDSVNYVHVLVNTQNKNGNIALNLSCKLGLTEISKLLIDRGSAVNNKNEHDRSPLHLASQNGHLEICKLLVNRGAAVNTIDTFGYIPLHLSSALGQLDICELLLNIGAKANAKSNRLRTPLHLTCQIGHLKICQLLLSKGAAINSKTKADITPLHISAKMGHYKVCEFLLRNGASVDSKGQGPLHVSSEKGYLEVCTLLIKNGASVNMQGRELNTPLHLASKSGHFQVCKLLLKKYAIVNRINLDHDTALHLSCRNGHIQVTILLQKYGADMYIQNLIGMTPKDLELMCAIENLEHEQVTQEEVRRNTRYARLRQLQNLFK